MHAGATGPVPSAAPRQTDVNKLYAALVGKRDAAVHLVPGANCVGAVWAGLPRFTLSRRSVVDGPKLDALSTGCDSTRGRKYQQFFADTVDISQHTKESA
jgi:hypothetical protein